RYSQEARHSFSTAYKKGIEGRPLAWLQVTRRASLPIVAAPRQEVTRERQGRNQAERLDVRGTGDHGHRERKGDRYREPAKQDWARHARPCVHEHRVDEERDHLPRWREGRAPVPRYPDRAARREVEVRRDRLPPHLRRPAVEVGARALLDAPHTSLVDP